MAKAFTIGTRVQKKGKRGVVVAVLRSAANERAVRVVWDEGGTSLEITADLRRTLYSEL